MPMINMIWNDEAAPYFHARYAEYNEIIDIISLKMLEGDLLKRALGLIVEWAKLHQAE